jgi:hypothetical protein
VPFEAGNLLSVRARNVQCALLVSNIFDLLLYRYFTDKSVYYEALIYSQPTIVKNT